MNKVLYGIFGLIIGAGCSYIYSQLDNNVKNTNGKTANTKDNTQKLKEQAPSDKEINTVIFDNEFLKPEEMKVARLVIDYRQKEAIKSKNIDDFNKHVTYIWDIYWELDSLSKDNKNTNNIRHKLLGLLEYNAALMDDGNKSISNMLKDAVKKIDIKDIIFKR